MLDILPQLFFNSLITGSIYALTSAGLALTFALTRVLNFAHGHIMMSGAYIFFLFHVQLEHSALVAACEAALSMSLLGAVSLLTFIIPFLSASALLPFVTTIALGSILEAATSMVFGVNVRSFPTDSASTSIECAGVFITPVQLLIIASAAVIFLILGLVMHRAPVGRAIRAVSDNTAAAASLGIPDRRVLFGVFIVSVLLAGYAGILVGYETNIQPTMGGSYSIKSFAAMLLGGLGSIWGTVLGALILGFIENLSVGLDFGGYSLPAGYKDAFAFAIILLVLLVRPQGLLGTKARSA